MALAAQDHRAAFEVLAGRYLGLLTRYCGKFVGNPRVGEELAQESLLELWIQRGRYCARGKLTVYLLTLARNRCLNHQRAETRRRRWGFLLGSPAPEEAAEVAAPAPATDQLGALLEAERSHRVQQALQRLPDKLREAALLRFDQGLEYPEIAAIVGRPEATVRSRVFLAMKALRSELGDPEE
ncbi:MAG: RNA polymerase sigma factor [Myxococcales bacterium]